MVYIKISNYKLRFEFINEFLYIYNEREDIFVKKILVVDKNWWWIDKVGGEISWSII